MTRALAALEAAGSLDYAQALAADWHMRALQALACTRGQGPAQDALYELTQQLLGRTA